MRHFRDCRTGRSAIAGEKHGRERLYNRNGKYGTSAAGLPPAFGRHAHRHVHTQTKAVVNRLARAIGHLESVKTMVEDGRDCTDVLVQLAAVRSALSSTAKVILKDHLEHCISDGEGSTEEQLRALNDAIDKFM